jgi:hypothetical protein
VSECFHYVAAPRPTLEDQDQWGLYLPDERRWVDIVFRSKREAERVIDEMRQVRLRGVGELKLTN